MNENYIENIITLNDVTYVTGLACNFLNGPYERKR